MRIVWNFILMQTERKQTRQTQRVKKEGQQQKVYFQVLCIGRGVASVAEQIHSTKEEAQKIIDDFYVSYPTIKNYTEKVQEDAKMNGYTTTAWGRRRYLVHIQDEEYSYKYNERRKVDFNPLFTAKSIINREVPQDIKDKYNDELSKANYYKQTKIIEKANEEGITITNNRSFIAEALRQCLNSVIQGSSADMSKRAMILLGQNEELKRLGFRMLFPVHDEIIAECPFENRKRCGELMSQLMIQSGADRIKVPMKCDVEKFFFWYGPDVSDEDDDLTMAQYNDYMSIGKYKEREDYIKGDN